MFQISFKFINNTSAIRNTELIDEAWTWSVMSNSICAPNTIYTCTYISLLNMTWFFTIFTCKILFFIGKKLEGSLHFSLSLTYCSPWESTSWFKENLPNRLCSEFPEFDFCIVLNTHIQGSPFAASYVLYRNLKLILVRFMFIKFVLFSQCHHQHNFPQELAKDVEVNLC